MLPDVVCRITQSQPPLRTRASHPHAGCAGLQPAYSDTPPGSAGFQPASSDMPRGCAGVQPACRERGLPACLSDMPRLGARASSPHAGCTGIAPAYSNTPHHPCTAWVRGLPARMPGAQALRPHTAIHPITPAPPGCAGVSPAQRCATWVRGLPPAYSDTPPGCAGFQPAYRDTPPGCAGVSPACWVRGLPARIPRYTTWVRRLPARLRRPTSEHGRPARIQ
jgi:hypothetical protein